MGWEEVKEIKDAIDRNTKAIEDSTEKEMLLNDNLVSAIYEIMSLLHTKM